jgi:hypothetical protein
VQEKLTRDQLIQQLDEPGWRSVGGESVPAQGTLRQMAEAAHERHVSGRPAGRLQHIVTRLEVDAIRLEELWYHLGLPLV